MKIRTRVRRIGITGSARAGKTVFLLSLISQLQDGDIKLGGVRISRFQQLPTKPGPFDKLLAKLPGIGHRFSDEKREFDYKGLRKHLAVGKDWPHKTTDSSFFRCRFQRDVGTAKWSKPSSWRPIERLSDDEIEFFDFPGERVADVTMIGQNFGKWSDCMIKNLTDDPAKAAAAASFFGAINRETPEPDAALAEWKLTLGRLLTGCHSLITPSTFCVDSKGNTARERVTALRDLKMTGDDVDDAAIKKRIKALRDANKMDLGLVRESSEEFAAACCAGLPDEEFTPLPETVRLRAPELARSFEAHYESYQREVIRPFAANLLSCHALISLVDLTDVLGSGAQKLNDTQEMIRNLLQCIEASRKSLLFYINHFIPIIPRLIHAALGRKWGYIDRIAFVASKEDKIGGGDRDNMEPLIKELAKDAQQIGPRDIGYFTCSAVDSTKPMPGEDRKLIGRPIWKLIDDKLVRQAPEDPKCEVLVPILPDHWPLTWQAKDYQFCDFYPAFPASHRQALPHSGLDEILKFILGS